MSFILLVVWSTPVTRGGGSWSSFRCFTAQSQTVWNSSFCSLLNSAVTIFHLKSRHCSQRPIHCALYVATCSTHSTWDRISHYKNDW